VNPAQRAYFFFFCHLHVKPLESHFKGALINWISEFNSEDFFIENIAECF